MKWIVASILLLFVAMALNLTLLVYAMYAIIAILVISKWITNRWTQAVEAERVCDTSMAKIGDFVSIMIRLKHVGRFPIAWVLVEDMLEQRTQTYKPPSLRIHGKRLEVMKLNPGNSKQLLYQLECNRRGYYQIGPLVLETGDMFGLNRRFKVLTEPMFLLVLPKIVPIESYDIASRRPIGEVVMTHRLFEDPTRIAGVRKYQDGDPLARVHWRATARTGKLQCKVYEPSTLAGGTVVVDFHEESFDPKNEPMRSELAITCAASVCNALQEIGQQVGLVSNGRDAADRIRQDGWKGDRRTREEAKNSAIKMAESDRLRPVIVPTRKSPEQMISISKTLARLEKTDGMRLSELVIESAAQIPRDATVIVIVSTITLENAVALGSLARQGYSVEVIVNCFSEEEFAAVSAPLFAEGITTRQLKDESSIAQICEKQMLR
ncbi:MAG: DUF58 domain-containing protein [Mariniblastus sp.]|nr:DUF58 domain-containing protein [Mariniblastus sp.]